MSQYQVEYENVQLSNFIPHFPFLLGVTPFWICLDPLLIVCSSLDPTEPSTADTSDTAIRAKTSNVMRHRYVVQTQLFQKFSLLGS